MVSVNQKLYDEAISHAVDLAQYSTGVVRRMIALLNRTDGDLMAQIVAALERMDPATFTVERLEGVLQSVRALNLNAYRQVEPELFAELRDFTAAEWEHQQAVLPSVGINIQLGVRVSATQVYAAALSRPFQGRLLSEWSKSLEADRTIRIRDTIRMGYVEGQTNDQIIRRIRGTKVNGFSDGILEIDRKHAEAVVRTAVQHTAATARDEMFRQNASAIKGLSWVSTLDGRTTTDCRIRDGKLYSPEEHKPIDHQVPWLAGPGRLHWRCRSTAVAVTKSYSELLGIPGLQEIPKGSRASMDGQVPAEQTYGEWLKKQSASRQDQILGPTRATLMRDGKLPFDALYTPRGEYLDLEELRKRNAASFKRAGI